MALQLSTAQNYSIAGRTYTQSQQVTGSLTLNGEPDVLKAQAGVVTSGGTTTSASLTLGASHGITTGLKVDVYWTGGRLLNATVGTVSGTTVPVSGGTYQDGPSAFPANATAVVVSPRTSESVGFVGNSLQGIVCNFAGAVANKGTFAFWSSGTLVYATAGMAGATVWEWDINNGYTNPFAGATIDQITYSHNETDLATISMRMGALVQ